jgi:hypothetical protein
MNLRGRIGSNRRQAALIFNTTTGLDSSVTAGRDEVKRGP